MVWKPNAPFRWVLLIALLAGFTHAAHTVSSQEKTGPPGMILIPAGAFTMGRSDGPKNEAPSHRLQLPAFWIDRNLVTQKQFADFMNTISFRRRMAATRGPLFRLRRSGRTHSL